MSILNKIFGDPNEKMLKQVQPLVDAINSLESRHKKFNDEELRGRTAELRKKLKDSNNDLNAVLPEAFAAMRESSRRFLGMRHYDVQLIGGIILHEGKIAEMKTGEGKTLVATLPLYLNALSGQGAHLVTVNDYLAKIGAGWMARAYHALGISVGVIVHENGLIYDPDYKDESQYDERLMHFRKTSRKEAYAADITYGTNNEFGFDYLRDNMAPRLEDKVQKNLSYSIVDEIDSILIDEARTPLIISAPAEESTDKYFKFAQLVKRLKENEDYNVDEKMKAATLSEAGMQRMEKWLGVDNIYTAGGVRDVHHIEQALKAHALFKRERDYVVKEGEVIIVDEFTGRLMHGRRYSEGLHQAIEAKEGVKIQRESQTLATITFQNYFRMYDKLAGMTGTAVTEAEEFSKIYGLETVIIPTNKPNIRKDENDLIYRTHEGKFKAVIEEVKKRTQNNQPVLVGTISIEKNEMLASMMARRGLKANVLNAKNHEKEARFIAEAGKPGAITIATNMAGRGVDIMLGGQEPFFSDEESGGQESERHKNWRREHQRVLDAGGLHVVGTERHESRRIDNQLRGRAARQGDPGSSRFFVSMEDDLMRIFGGDRMRSIMTTLKVPEDMPIENRIISRSIESAQKKVEGNNFDIRKHLVEYDDVLNKHREAIYRLRNEVLEKFAEERSADEAKGKVEGGKTLEKIILGYIESEVEQVVSFHTAADDIASWNIKEIGQVVSTIFAVSGDMGEEISKYAKSDNNRLDKAKARTDIIDHIYSKAEKKYAEMKSGAEESGLDWLDLERSVLLRSIDALWIEHLEAISSVRQGIGLRGYGQRDPLVEYKKEAYRLFNELKSLIQKEVVYSIFKLSYFKEADAGLFSSSGLIGKARQFQAPSKTADDSNYSFSAFKADSKNKDNTSSTLSEPRQKPKTEDGKKVGRNDPCPCGSGKKYKKCCGR